MKIHYVLSNVSAKYPVFIHREIKELIKNGHIVEVISLTPKIFINYQCELLKNIKIIYPSSNPFAYIISTLYGLFVGKSVLLSKDYFKTSIVLLSEKNPIKSLFNFLIIDNLIYKIKKEKITIEHIHSHHLFLATYCTFQISKKINVSYSLTLHTLSNLFTENILKNVLNNAVFLRAISTEIIPYFNKFICNNSKFHYISNGVNEEEFKFNPPIEKYNHFLVLAVGSLLDKKGFDLLVQACHLLKDSNFPFVCEIYGEGSEKSFLETIINNLNLHNEIKIIGQKPNNEIIQRMQQSQVLVMPSREPKRSTRDGLPTVIIEAMACKLPVISTNFAGIPDIVIHNVTGIVVPQEDYKSIANAIISLAYDNHLKEKLTNTAFDFVKNNYSLTKSVNKLEILFKEKSLN
ncbi:MAG: glycosyltransferase family 4 protein [Bacteroidia bacterium]|nr:glycosyltransferase family 4 protein [Bacteroidia bacterium]